MSARLAPFLQASAFAFRSFPLLLRLPLAFAPLGNKRHHHHLRPTLYISNRLSQSIGALANFVGDVIHASRELEGTLTVEHEGEDA